MATPRRRQSLTLIQQLLKQPQGFQFFQAVRLLERAAVLNERTQKFALEPVATQAMPNREVIRFNAQPYLSFSPSDIKRVHVIETHSSGDSDSPDLQWAMEVCFMGLTGSQGVMPHYLSELVLRELRTKNESLLHFLDMFNHRSISLYYQAWHKYQLPVNVERNRQRQSRNLDIYTHALCALAGVGSNELIYRTPLPAEAMAGLAGLMGRSVSTADGLQRMIKHYFGLDVEIEQFQGQWQEMPEDVLCRLPGPEYPSGVNNCLGTNTVLGTSCHHAQSKFRVVVAPMSYDDFSSIAPGSKKLEALKSFIQFSAGNEMDFDISVSFRAAQVAPVQLRESGDYQPLLGWNSHMCFENSGSDSPVAITLAQDIDSPEESLPLAS